MSCYRVESEYAARIGSAYYRQLPEAIAAALEGETVLLLRQYQGEALLVDKAITIDLGNTGTAPASFSAGTGYQMTQEDTRLCFGPSVYTVTFESSGGSPVPSVPVQHGQPVARPADPSREGYTFAGWYQDAALTAPHDFAQPVTGPLILYAGWTPVSQPDPPGGGGSSGGGSSSSGDRTQTTVNPDGSTTTVTRPDGSSTQTTRYPDGSQQVVDTGRDGTVTTTQTGKDGSQTAVTQNPDGTALITVSTPDGASSTTAVDGQGGTTTWVTLPAEVAEGGAQKGEAVALPMPALTPGTDADSAPTVTLSLSGAPPARVEIPVDQATAGTVAVLVHDDGREEIIRRSIATRRALP